MESFPLSFPSNDTFCGSRLSQTEQRDGLAEAGVRVPEPCVGSPFTPAHHSRTPSGQSENSCSRSIFIPFRGLRATWVELRSGPGSVALKLNFGSPTRFAVSADERHYRVADPSPWRESGPVFLQVAAIPIVDAGALTGSWRSAWLYWWLHLGSVATKSCKEFTTPKYEAGADVVSILCRGLNSGCVSVLSDHLISTDD